MNIISKKAELEDRFKNKQKQLEQFKTACDTIAKEIIEIQAQYTLLQEMEEDNKKGDKKSKK